MSGLYDAMMKQVHAHGKRITQSEGAAMNKNKRKLVVTITAGFDLVEVSDFVSVAECLNEAIEKLREQGTVEVNFEFED